MSALPTPPPCPARSYFYRVPCQLEQGHDGSHRHVDPATGGTYWSDVAPLLERAKRDGQESV